MAARRDDQTGLPGIAARDAILGGDAEQRPWAFRLSIMLRVLSFVELVKGLAHWGALIGAGGAADPLAGKPAIWLVGAVFFAVADPVAAVGLWIGAAWGVVIWLLAALGQLAAVALTPHSTLVRGFVVGVTLIAMGVYVFLSLKARREVS